MFNKQCLGLPAGASWHSVSGHPVVEEKLSPRSDFTKCSIPRPLISAKAPQPSKTLAARAGNMKRPKRFNKPVGRKSWRDVTLGDGADFGYKAWVLAKKISTLINVEEKINDVDGSAGTVVSSTATIVNLSNIAQGTDYFNRTGDSILAQSLEFRAVAFGSDAASGGQIRVLIVADKEQNGTDPTIGEVLQGGTSPIVQPYNIFYEQRFNVLYDEVVTFQNDVGLATAGTSTTYVRDRKVLPSMMRKWNKHIKYDASAAADTSNRENALFLMMVSESASNGPTLQYSFRLRFTDN